jgi:hypothetical protein
MALLYWWMKCWQAVFAAAVRAQLAGRPASPWTVRGVGRLALTQLALQPSGLFAVPLSLVVIFPFAWVFGFYQNLTAAAADTADLGAACKTAAVQSGVRLGQNWLLLGVLFLFAVLVWLNTLTAMALLPSLLKMLLGIDSAFTQAGLHSILNTTYFACSFALTYILVDPLVKTLFVLRCFYAQSIHSGDDLQAELARLRASALSAGNS